ncbi:MAG: NifB/NifX family molybdenum-iron cluster-binding protein [Bacilli bacterium]|nr:NifB/NifX family molybdenum-iron cluster-binding protein [Bacilli bacterium]
MKIAVTYDQGMVYPHFGHTKQFKVYEIKANEVMSEEVIDTNGAGHCALASFLVENKIEVLICGGIGAGAISALSNAGIEIYPGVMGEADMVVEDFIAGILEYDPNTRCDHHNHEHNCGDHDCGDHHGDCHCHDK